ncbi:H-NS histone family protein [Escherichia coli]|mgnify:CR=1 FL=1|jgi:DNA-binding protein H-NS|uniref:H-NS histone family protein n=1 Tax=Enterobacteriaceae TaxID=543 RepID=UPI0002AABD5B|nr:MULTISPECIES: H-NS histone family protein [Enterobacteriaceae]EEV2752958.1 H-NS histone family protein [Escherichia coli O139]EEZ5759310.1 H-NS histone family protein [Escherichia coli O101]EEZ6621041.1 H-NS histone family protein [Escherichia coli O7]EIH1082273.1 H-NS histone family protein [Escherichia coli O163:H38]EKH5290053.1 H-NS histone family protein [Escherichia coli O76]MBJ5936629.1 H-NS histone family protein [Salmonella enterica subsp. enterica serovar Derby]HAN3546489.1 H-NS 
MSKKKFSVENEDLSTVRTSLLNFNLVRKLIMEMSDEDFNQVKDNLEKAIEQRNELKDSLAIIKKYMDDAGVTAEDVYREFGKKLQTGRKNDSGESNKYRYEYNGQIMYWSGQGRRPSVIAEAIKAGGSLDDFLISQGTSSSCSDYE